MTASDSGWMSGPTRRAGSQARLMTGTRDRRRCLQPLEARKLLGPLLAMAIWAVPNNEAAWWHDRIYDGCMWFLDDDHDWECETRLPAIDE